MSDFAKITHTYFKSEEAPLCRFEFQLIITSRGDGISANLAQNLDILRRVGTLPAVLSKSITISRGTGIPPNLTQNLDILRRGRTLFAVLLKVGRGGHFCCFNSKKFAEGENKSRGLLAAAFACSFFKELIFLLLIPLSGNNHFNCYA